MTRNVMAGILVLGLGAVPVAIVGCQTIATKATQLAGTQPGQLFCALTSADGGSVVAAVQQTVDTAASALGPIGTLAAVIATNATDSLVQGACKAAAKATGATVGLPVSPPAAPGSAPVVTVPASAVKG